MAKSLEDRYRRCTENLYISGHLLHNTEERTEMTTVRLANMATEVAEAQELLRKIAKRNQRSFIAARDALFAYEETIQLPHGDPEWERLHEAMLDAKAKVSV